MFNIEYLWKIIDEIETKESCNSVNFDPILHDARCAERMKAWEKLLYWALDGVNVS